MKELRELTGVDRFHSRKVERTSSHVLVWLVLFEVRCVHRGVFI